MQKRFEISVLLIALLVPQAAQAQMFEGVGTQGLSVGLGAGLAASLNHGEVAAKSFQRLLQAQKVAAEQTQAIQQYMKNGVSFEAKKQWADAETCFKYVLQVTTMRDGYGSPTSGPVLKRLVAVTAAQNHVAEAISFQKTVVAFAQNAKIPNPTSVVSAQLDLTKLYFKNEDFAQAAPVMQQSVQLVDAHPTLPATQRREVKQCYATILRKLHRDSEADAIEAELALAQSNITPSKSPAQSKSAVELNPTDDPMSIMPPGLPPEPSPESTPNVSPKPTTNGAAGAVATGSTQGAAADTVAPQPATNNLGDSVVPTSASGQAPDKAPDREPRSSAPEDTTKNGDAGQQ